MEEQFSDKKFIEGGEWETCCLKKLPTGDEKPGMMGYTAFGVLVSPRPPMLVYLRASGPKGRDFENVMEYDTVDAMLEDGWIVD
jgi:hypothetical protein